MHILISIYIFIIKMLYYKLEIWNKEGDGFISVLFNAQSRTSQGLDWGV